MPPRGAVSQKQARKELGYRNAHGGGNVDAKVEGKQHYEQN